MVQKRPLENEEAIEFSFKLPRQDHCDRTSFFPISVPLKMLTRFPTHQLMVVLPRESLPMMITFFPERKILSILQAGMVTWTAPFLEVIPFLLVAPRKQVPIGPLYQADIPPLKGVDVGLNLVNSPAASRDAIREKDEGIEPHAGTAIIPMHGAASSEEVVIKLGHSRTDCSCLDKGSIRCDRRHIFEARDKLKTLFGLKVLEELGFSDMGEPVAEKCTEEEENLFHEAVFSNPSSMCRNFQNYLCHAFPSRTVVNIVSYYFNVFMLRKRAEQNRFDPMNVDSENDEWQANEDSVVESPMYHLHPVERSRDHSIECGDKNLVDETCVDDEYTSPVSVHIRRIDDLQADGDFEPREMAWDERSYHCTQDDSCVSFDTGDVGPGSQVQYDIGVSIGDVWDAAQASCMRSEDDLMPTFGVI